LPLSSTLGYEHGISAVPRDRRRRFRGTRRHKLDIVKDLHQLKKLSQGPVRRPAGLNSPATRSSAGFVMRKIQTVVHKPEGGTKQRLTKSADNSAPVCCHNCASICLGFRVSFDLPLALNLRHGFWYCSDRWVECGCGVFLDRDHNAAIVVFQRAWNGPLGAKLANGRVCPEAARL
jgi:hypothetical protein